MLTVKPYDSAEEMAYAPSTKEWRVSSVESWVRISIAVGYAM